MNPILFFIHLLICKGSGLFNSKNQAMYFLINYQCFRFKEKIKVYAFDTDDVSV